jgi:HK97 family phage major capsid protein/HK97 family phage prohead protease
MEKLYRTAVIELDRAGNGGEVSASLSSEEPVDRPGFGREVLDHSPASVDLSRTRSGLPLLWQHNADEIIGRAVDIRLENKKLRANLKPARNQRAAEVWQDIKDGIVKDLSIGYSIDPQSIQREKDGTMRVMRWKVFETSAVSIPADATVGIGRNIQTQNLNLRKEPQMIKCEVCKATIQENQPCPACAERARVRELLEIGRRFKMEKEASDAVSGGMELDSFRRLVMEKMETKSAIFTPKIEGDLTPREFQPSIKGKVSYRSIFGPPPPDHDFQNLGDFAFTVKNRPYDPRLQKRTHTGGVGTSGGYTVPERLNETIFDNALEESVLFQRVRIFPMSSDILRIPAPSLDSHATGIYNVTGEWVAEGSAAPEQNLRLRQIELKSGKLFLFARCSSELLADSMNFGTVLDTAFKSAASWHLDRAILSGNGVGSPAGIIGSACTLKVTRAAAGSIGIADLAGMVAKLNPGSFANSLWVIHPTTVTKLFQLTIAVGAGGSYIPIQESNGELRIFTRPVVISEKVATLGSEGDVLLCDPSQYFLGIRQQMILESTNSESFQRDLVSFRLICRIDGQPAWNQPLTLKDGVSQISPFVVLN